MPEAVLSPTPAPATRAKTAADENFPVGSWLIAPAWRPTVAAFYRLARMADDIADSPALTAEEKLARLEALDALLRGEEAAIAIDHADAAIRLRELIGDRGLSIDHPRHLLQAFMADARNRRCCAWSDLLLYCRYSAAPVGRFLLELHGEDKAAWPASDALCAALQILNHVQDCGDDWRKLGRLYLPEDWLAEAGARPDDLLAAHASPALRRVMDRVLDGVDRLNEAARPLTRQIGDRRLRMEAAGIIAIAIRLAAKLRRRDPLARRVVLTKAEYAWAIMVGMVRGARA